MTDQTLTETTRPYDEALSIDCRLCGQIDFIRPAVTTIHTRGATRTTLAATTEHPCTPTTQETP